MRSVSCRLHDIEPSAYLRDLFCLLAGRNQTRVLELAPAFGKDTATRPDVLQQLAANPFQCITENEGDSSVGADAVC